jgi:hypothetical protein
VVLYWNQQQYRRTVKLLPHTNVGVIRTAPGIQQYAHMCSLLEKKLGIITMPATIDLGLENAQSTHGVGMVHKLCHAQDIAQHNLCRDPNECSKSTLPTIPEVTDSEGETEHAETSKVTHEESQQESPNNGKPLPEFLHPEYSLAQQELLHWHYHLKHLSFTRIQEMAKQRLLPARLAKCINPLCSGCI